MASNDDFMGPQFQITAILDAVAAERERNAKIAEDWHPMLYAPEMGGNHPRDAAYRDARDAIAAAIRGR